MDMMTTNASETVVEPFSLKDAPSLIERLWPAQKISVEAEVERGAGRGQTLPALGGYWKGRKPLILVRACLLAALLPATDDSEEDLNVFEILLQIDDAAFAVRDRLTKPSEFAQIALSNGVLSPANLNGLYEIKGWKETEAPTPDDFIEAAEEGKLRWSANLRTDIHKDFVTRVLAQLPYAERARRSVRPEELGRGADDIDWERVNCHLRTAAYSLSDLVQQLGVMRYGRSPVVVDTFAGGGSIPFEAARMGADVYASDLNPIACMLTWGALNVIGASEAERHEIEEAQSAVAKAVDNEITMLGVERDKEGNRAKAFLYCLETRCPSSGWMVPMLPNRIISRSRNIIARLVPDHEHSRYDIVVEVGVDTASMQSATQGTVQDGFLIHNIDGVNHRTAIKSIRGDFKGADKVSRNALRQWEKSDIAPRPDDIFQERLYCIQWITRDTLYAGRQDTYFAAPTREDLEREHRVAQFVQDNLSEWQGHGFVPDMPIEAGSETTRLNRERGWSYWHHLFGPRDLLFGALIQKHSRHPVNLIDLCKNLDLHTRLSRWDSKSHTTLNAMYNQALNTNFTWLSRGSFVFVTRRGVEQRSFPLPSDTKRKICSHAARDLNEMCDIGITDPPYADAVNYHEITEFFIGWLRKNPRPPFDSWTWDSRRALAIKGDGEDFRREMVAAYKALADHMPDNGMQIVMFTHQSGSVWGDMAQIFWGAGLHVQAAWYIATETSSELKKGGYVQGTVILVLRKRCGNEAGYEDEIAQEVRAEVARQIDALVGLNQSLKGAGRIENLFEDADLQMAGYAAALRVLTGYTRIDGVDMTAEAVRPRRKGEKGFVERIIEFAVQVANEHMVPSGLTPRLWQQLSGTERFYLKMIDLEAADLKKLDNYQNFARAFRVPDYTAVMADMRPNAARLKGADDFKHRTGFDIPDFGQGIVRGALYGIYQLAQEVEPDVVLDQLRGMVENYYRRREDLIEVAEYIASQRGRDDEREGRYAGLLAQLIRNERLG